MAGHAGGVTPAPLRSCHQLQRGAMGQLSVERTWRGGADVGRHRPGRAGGGCERDRRARQPERDARRRRAWRAAQQRMVVRRGHRQIGDRHRELRDAARAVGVVPTGRIGQPQRP